MKNYNANEVSCIFAAISLDSGRGEDEFISIAKQEDTYTVKEGVDGEATRNKKNKTYTVVTLTLMASSDGNAKLTAIHNGDIATEGGKGVAPLLIRDRQGTTVFESAEAWIVKWPDRTFAGEVGEVQWMIGTIKPNVFIGGN